MSCRGSGPDEAGEGSQRPLAECAMQDGGYGFPRRLLSGNSVNIG